MKKIISILLLVTCIFCVTSCGDKALTPDKADNFEEICAVLSQDAVTYRLSDEDELKQHIDFFSGENHNYSEDMVAMCYAKMSDGYIKCIKMVDRTDAEYFLSSYGRSFAYTVQIGNVAIFGSSSYIEQFKAS